MTRTAEVAGEWEAEGARSPLAEARGRLGTALGEAQATGAVGWGVQPGQRSHPRAWLLAQTAKGGCVPGAAGKGWVALRAQLYLRVLHQVAAALEPVVELRHPPGSNDLNLRGQ